jgi:disulfide bond formation protein DsbB
MSLLIALLLTLNACGGGDDPTPTPKAATTAPEAAVAATIGDPVAGEQVYKGTCIACHGPDARGVQNLGKTLHPSDSDFISSRTDDELVEYIKVGRTPDDPLNTTGVGMPAKGGNPALSEADMYNVIAYIRTLE